MKNDFDKKQIQQIHKSKFNDSSGIKCYKSTDEYLKVIKGEFKPPTKQKSPAVPEFTW